MTLLLDAAIGVQAFLNSLAGCSTTERGARFASEVARMLRTVEPWASEVKRVWTWGEWPGAWGPDNGIDLIAETLSGELWAIQCKGYAETTSVTKKDVSSFLSQSARAGIAYRLLVASTNHISRAAREEIGAAEKKAGLLLLDQLEELDFSWGSETPGVAPVRFEARPHQYDAVAAIARGVSHGERRGQIIMPCGTGKTLVAIRAAEELGSRRILVGAPSLALLGQHIANWRTHYAPEFRQLVVCSDDTVAGDEDLRAAELGLPTTTDPVAIHALLQETAAERVIVFATYQSMSRIADAMALGALVPFDLAIVDEAHRTTGAGRSSFTDVLNDERVAVGTRLFFTATPRFIRVSERGAAVGASMDHPALYGPVFYEMSMRQAIEAGVIVDYEVLVDICPGIGTDQLNATIEGVAMSGHEVVAGRGLLKALAHTGATRVITYHSTVARARRFATMLATESNGAVTSYSVSGRDSASRKRSVLAELGSGGADTGAVVVSNCKCLVEGIDVPSVDLVAMIDPRQSLIEVSQAFGRAGRPSPGKRKAFIYLPLHGDPGEDGIQDTAYSTIASVLAAMRSHDERLGESIDGAIRDIGRGRASALPSHVRFMTTIDPALLDKVNTAVIRQAGMGWWYELGVLEAAIDTLPESSTNEPSILVALARHLGLGHDVLQWVSRQDKAQKAGRLNDAQLDALSEVLGKGWRDIVGGHQWQVLLLAEYAEGRPSTGASCEAGLRSWAHLVRGAPEQLDADARELLEHLVPQFCWLDENAPVTAIVAEVERVLGISTTGTLSDPISAGVLWAFVAKCRAGDPARFLCRVHLVEAPGLDVVQWLARVYTNRVVVTASQPDFSDLQDEITTAVTAGRRLWRAGSLHPACAEVLLAAGWEPYVSEVEMLAAVARISAFAAHEMLRTDSHDQDGVPVGELLEQLYHARCNGVLPESVLAAIAATPSWQWQTVEQIQAALASSDATRRDESALKYLEEFLAGHPVQVLTDEYGVIVEPAAQEQAMRVLDAYNSGRLSPQQERRAQQLGIPQLLETERTGSRR